MHTDTRGHVLTTNSDSAANACATAMDHYMERKSDVSVLLQEALTADPECAIAHATMGLMLHGVKSVDLQPLVRDSLEQAKKFASGITDREKRYIDALEFATQGQLDKTVASYEAILEHSPTDGFALSLVQAELFWLGDMRRSLATSSSVASHWNDSIAGYSEFLGMHAFDLEEAGQFDIAERVGRDAVDLNGANIWATHAVTHVLYMQGRHNEGIEWISNAQKHWDGIGQMQFHVWWHKCLIHLERGEHDAVLEGYDRWVRNREHELVQALPDLYIDLQNGASLLWRLELAGVNVGDRWQEMASLVALRRGDFCNPFTSAHFAIILAAVGDFKNCDLLVEEIAEFSVSNNASIASHYAKAGLPAVQAAIAHRKGQYQQVFDLLYPVRNKLALMGGSHAQQDLFFQILVDAAARLGLTEQVAQLMIEIEKIGFVEPIQMSAYKLITDRAV